MIEIVYFTLVQICYNLLIYDMLYVIAPSTTVQKQWIIPTEIHDDTRISAVMTQTMEKIDGPMRSLQPIPSSSISSISHGGRVLLPVIAASRVGSDIQAAVDKAKLGESRQN